MLQCMSDRIAIYGYDTYTGRFLKWYANHYHSIEVDYLVSEDMSTGKGYDREVFRPSIFDFGYKDVRNCIIWLAQPLTEELSQWLSNQGYEKNVSFYDFYDAIYGDTYWADEDIVADVFNKAKSGKRDIQFLEWLEYKYNCNFVLPIAKDKFKVVANHGARYSCSTQKEIFPMLDRCHFHPSEEDAIFDFGLEKAVLWWHFSTMGLPM